MNPFRLRSAILGAIVSLAPSISSAERLGSCGVPGILTQCESKALQAFRVAARVIDDAIMACGQVSAMFPGECTDDPAEDDLAFDMATEFKHGRESVAIEFKSERENPGFFMLDGQVRLAKTGSRQKDVIFINSDMAEANQLDIPDALSILAHELGHHSGIKDHQKLDKFGARIKNFIMKFQITASELLPGSASDQLADLTVFNLASLMNGLPYAPLDGNANLFLWDGFDYIDLTAELLPKLCEPGYNVLSFSVKSATLALAGDSTLLIKTKPAYACMPLNGFARLHSDRNAYNALPIKKSGDRVTIDASQMNWNIKKCSEDHDLGC